MRWIAAVCIRANLLVILHTLQMCVWSHLNFQMAKTEHNVWTWMCICLFKWLLLYDGIFETGIIRGFSKATTFSEQEKEEEKSSNFGIYSGFWLQPFFKKKTRIHSRIYRIFLFRLPLLVVVHINACFALTYSGFFSLVHPWIVWIFEMKTEIRINYFAFNACENKKIGSHKKFEAESSSGKKANPKKRKLVSENECRE